MLGGDKLKELESYILKFEVGKPMFSKIFEQSLWRFVGSNIKVFGWKSLMKVWNGRVMTILEYLVPCIFTCQEGQTI